MRRGHSARGKRKSLPPAPPILLTKAGGRGLVRIDKGPAIGAMEVTKLICPGRLTAPMEAMAATAMPAAKPVQLISTPSQWAT